MNSEHQTQLHNITINYVRAADLEVSCRRCKASQWSTVRPSGLSISDKNLVRVRRGDADQILSTDSCRCQRTDVAAVSTTARNVGLVSFHRLKRNK